MIAVLSPWNLRLEGFCRNEVLFAQSCRKPIIPVRIAEITPPIQIISLNYIDAAANADAAFAALPAAIQQIVQTGSMGYRDWPSPKPTHPWWSSYRQPRFEEELARHGGSFIGRDWFFAEVQAWTKKPASRLLLVTADAGFGKSAAAAQMTTRLNVRAVHFCSRSMVESCRPQEWLSSLIYQLAAQFPAYRASLEDRDKPPDWSHPPESLFRELIADPLRRLADRLEICEPWIFVVDALDESVAEVGYGLADLLADSTSRIPEFFRLIVTSRQDRSIMARFHLDGVQSRHLDAHGEPNQRDLKAYIEQRIQVIQPASASQTTLPVAKLAEIADGNFLFAKLNLDALISDDDSGGLTLDELGALPGKLGGLYHAMFRKRFAHREAYEQQVLPLLDCLVASLAPLPEPLLASASGLDAREAQRGVLALSQFLTADLGGLRCFHQSLADWLCTPGASAEYAASDVNGHQRLAEQGWREFNASVPNLFPYMLAHLPAHLIASRQLERVAALLTSIFYLEARVAAGRVFDLVREFAQAATLLPRKHPKQMVLQLLEEALKRDIHFIALHPTTLFQCLWNSGWWYDCEQAQAHLLAPATAGSPPEVPWDDERLRLSDLLETWLDQKRVRDPDFTWVRALRPPAIALGSGQRSVFRGHSDRVFAVAYSPDGTRMVSGSGDNTVRLWDTASGSELKCFRGHTHWVRSVAFSPCGQRIASASLDSTTDYRASPASTTNRARCSLLTGYKTTTQPSPKRTRRVNSDLSSVVQAMGSTCVEAIPALSVPPGCRTLRPRRLSCR